MMTPDVVKRPMRQAFGIGDGRTLSVVKDMERKSPVIITMTTACLLYTSRPELFAALPPI